MPKILDLSVPILVIGIGGFVRNPHGKKRYGGRHQIQGRMRGFRQNSQAAGADPHENLQPGNTQSGQQRIARSFALLCPHRLGSERGWDT